MALALLPLLVATLLLTTGTDAKNSSVKLHHNKKKGGKNAAAPMPAPLLGATYYDVQKLTSPSGNSIPGNNIPGFGTWNLPQGTDNWNSPGSMEAYSGCDAKAFAPVIQICIQSGTYLDRISFMFKNGDSYAYGGSGGGIPNVRNRCP